MAAKGSTMDAPVDQVESDETVAPEATDTEGTKRGRGSVTYFGKGLETLPALDELPEEAPRKRGASSQYFDMLTTVAEDGERVGKWNPIAQFATPSGAKTIANQLNKQVRGEVDVEGQEHVKGHLKVDQVKRIPEFEGWTWHFDDRRTQLEDGTEGSILYAKLAENASA
jgi:hypothetical protein